MRFVIACGGAAIALASTPAWAQIARPAPAATLRADVGEWNVVPSVGSVRAGRVRITVRNLGNVAHRLVLVRTDTFDPRLELRGDRAVVRPLAASKLISPGGTTSLVVVLPRGSYLLLDNLPWRYWKGTSAAFSVR
jgi:hypothetical protein